MCLCGVGLCLYLQTPGDRNGMLPPAQESRLGSLAHPALALCALPATALAFVPSRLCSLCSWTDLLAGCRPGTHPEMPDPPSLWFSNCRKVH